LFGKKLLINDATKNIDDRTFNLVYKKIFSCNQ
jgi:hypothetical protein